MATIADRLNAYLPADDPWSMYYDSSIGSYLDPATGKPLTGGRLEQLRYLTDYHKRANAGTLRDEPGVMTQADFGPFQANPFAGTGGLLGTPGNQPQGVTAQDRVNARAQALADARLRDQTRPQTTLADLFGIGGGDWASQWGRQADPRSRINQNFYQGLGLDTGIFNSPTGPYGQLQQAAAYTAPARNDRQARMYEADTAKDIAKLKYGTANRVLGHLANLMTGGGQLNGFETDYGASAMLRPTNLRRFF